MNKPFQFVFKNKELLFQVFLVIFLFLSTFFVFKLFQKPVIYDNTLRKITHTYVRDTANKELIFTVNHPFYYRNAQNLANWDAGIYLDIRNNSYKSDWYYAFFPLFPLLWKATGISIIYVGLVNYLIFGISLIILASIFIRKTKKPLTDRLILFSLALTLPPIVVYYIPYAEALFTLTFIIAVWGLVKKKYAVYFIFMTLFAMTRPVFTIVGLSMIIIDLLYLIKHKNIPHFIKELVLKLLPLITGTLAVFFIFYFQSGSFLKYFEAINKYWHVAFQIPSLIKDWSIEGFGMNVFSIFFIILPSMILLIYNFISYIFHDRARELKGIFNGDTGFIKEYFFHISIVYFWGVFAFTIFYQQGSLNGLSRYIIASPFFYIFFFFIAVKEIKPIKLLIVLLPALAGGLFMLTGITKLKPEINFSDSGFFTLLLSFIYLFVYRYLNNVIKLILLGLVLLFNIIWITYLYNIYLCNGWIFT